MVVLVSGRVRVIQFGVSGVLLYNSWLHLGRSYSL